MTLAETERAALAQELLQVGPDAPTRCEGWTTQDLLVHLLIRERRPDAIPGTFLALGRSWTRKVSQGFRARPWAGQVQLFATRPGGFNPIRFRRVDDAVNSGEYFIHLEDVRRGRPGWQPRVYDPDTAAKLSTMVHSRLLALQLRRAGVGLVGVLPSGERVTLRSGDPTVALVGDPGEIILFSSGRPAARVELRGSTAALDTLRRNGFTVDPTL